MQNELIIYDAVMKLAEECDQLSGTKDHTQLLLTKVGNRTEYARKMGVKV